VKPVLQAVHVLAELQPGAQVVNAGQLQTLDLASKTRPAGQDVTVATPLAHCRNEAHAASKGLAKMPLRALQKHAGVVQPLQPAVEVEAHAAQLAAAQAAGQVRGVSEWSD
jgi:hypothetical protein